MARRHQHGKREPGGSVRIIGGRWRGRKLAVAPRPALRPSPDRVRETLFNWLTPYLAGARCLDLFAGTGVLGFEAASRGAASATLLDNDHLVAAHLRDHAKLLGATEVTVIESDALAWLRSQEPTPYDIVFIDPPFGHGQIETAIDELQRGWLGNHAWVYLEAEKIPILQLEAAGWRVTREGRTRHIRFVLATPDAKHEA